VWGLTCDTVSGGEPEEGEGNVQFECDLTRFQDGVLQETLDSPVDWPGAMTFHTGALWLADQDSNKIYRLDEELHTSDSFEYPGINPHALGSDGISLWVVDQQNFMKALTVNGEEVNSFELPYESMALDLAFDGQNFWLLVAEGGSAVYRLDTNGQTLNRFSLPAFQEGAEWVDGQLLLGSYETFCWYELVE